MNSDGRMLVEFVLGVGLMGFLLSGTVTLLRRVHEKQILGVAARYGTFLQSYAGIDETLARSEIKRFLDEAGVADVKISMGRYTATPASRFYRFGHTRLEKGPLRTEIICEQEGP